MSEKKPKKPPPTPPHRHKLQLDKGGPREALAAHPAPVCLDPGPEAVHVLHTETGQGTPKPGHAAAQLHGQGQTGQGLRGRRRRPRAG